MERATTTRMIAFTQNHPACVSILFLMAVVLSCTGRNSETQRQTEGIVRRTADTSHFYEDIRVEMWGTVHESDPEVLLAGR